MPKELRVRGVSGGPYAVIRLQTVIDDERPDVMTARSQGSLISAVAMSLTTSDRVPELFITCVSQLGHLCPTLFPAIGLDRPVTTLDSHLGGRWLDRWRRTDPIGGEVIDRLESRNWEVVSGSGHSHELTPEFWSARNAVDTEIRNRPAHAEMVDCRDRLVL